MLRKAEIDQAIFRIIEIGRLDLVNEVQAFEVAFTNWVNAQHAVTKNSGTAAMPISLLALRIGSGDEVHYRHEYGFWGDLRSLLNWGGEHFSLLSTQISFVWMLRQFWLPSDFGISQCVDVK